MWNRSPGGDDVHAVTIKNEKVQITPDNRNLIR
jgi:hypothetical protein